jgi:hypothetical protein
MKPQGDEAPIPDLLLERYRLNELSLVERATIERRIGEDDTLRQRLDEIERSEEAIRKSGFLDSLATSLREQATIGTASGRSQTGTPHASQTVRRWALPVAVGVAVVLVVAVSLLTVGRRPDEERVKGLRPTLTMFRQTVRGSEVLADGAAARAGDVVRLAYQAAGRQFGVILSVDGRGGVTVHLPPGGRKAARLRAGNKVLLDQAYELDDAPRWECFYFVTAPVPFEVQTVVDAANREGTLRRGTAPPKLALSSGLEQSAFVLHKEPRP